MPFINESTLTEKLRKKLLSWSEAFKIILPITEALTYIQDQGVIHCDIKSSNIMFKQNREPVLVDFGIAKVLEESLEPYLTQTRMGIGTPEYTAPEPWIGKTDKVSDRYSLGMVLF